MKNHFLEELKHIAMESVDMSYTVDPYAGSECADEYITLDVLDASAVAMESYEDALFSETFDAQELALESADLTFADISKFNGELSMESLANAVKRGAYGAEIQVKKIAQKILKFIVAIMDYFTVADGKFKSYNKLLKKYREKLSKLNPAAATGDKEESEYTVRKWDHLAKAHTAFVDEANVENLKRLANAASNANVSGIINALGLVSGKSVSKTENAIDKALEDWKSDLKEDLDDIKEEFKDKETIDGNFQDLKPQLLKWAAQAEKDTAKDIKFKNDLAKIKKSVAKLSGKTTEKNADDIRIINKVAPVILTGVQKKATLRYKLLTSGYQGLLADMAKLISAGTKVND